MSTLFTEDVYQNQGHQGERASQKTSHNDKLDVLLLAVPPTCSNMHTCIKYGKGETWLFNRIKECGIN